MAKEKEQNKTPDPAETRGTTKTTQKSSDTRSGASPSKSQQYTELMCQIMETLYRDQTRGKKAKSSCLVRDALAKRQCNFRVQDMEPYPACTKRAHA